MHLKTSSLFFKKIEIVLVATLLFIHGLYYNFIGHLSSLRQIDYGPYLASGLDNLLPIMLWVSPLYLFIWIYPLCVLVYFFIKKKYDCGFYRKIYCGFLAMMILAYIIWLWFPTHVNLYLSSKFLLTQGEFGSLTEFIYHNASPWNANPSFHIAVVWYVYRINKVFFNRFNWLFLVFALLTIISVLAIRIHYFLDIFGGIMLAESIIWLVIKPLNHSRWIEKWSSLTWIFIYLTVFIIAMVVYSIINELL